MKSLRTRLASPETPELTESSIRMARDSRNAVVGDFGASLVMIFPGMWKGVVFGFFILAIIAILFFTVFSKIMPGENDPGDEILPEDM